MVFSSPLFLFLFLPIALIGLLIPGTRAKNSWLLLLSVIFYAWGEVVFVFLMLGLAAMNYLLGLWVDRSESPPRRRAAVTAAVIANIGVLVFFKYSSFALANFNNVLAWAGQSPLTFEPLRLPIGISFLTFHALSYVLDIYRRKTPAARNPADTALYIFFFPQLIAGPILRWSAISPQLLARTTSSADFAEGVRRFVGGLAKKVLIANTAALPADQIFALPADQLSTSAAWLGLVCYTIQIYFDFSGYSDMAVGLGRMFGFTFMENFNFPYVARSMTDFWRRWHISLSSWFRDYLYIPLGGNRHGTARTYANLMTVFFLCGLWHGASWTFVAWGIYHGVFLIFERGPTGRLIEAAPRMIQHVYTIAAFTAGWLLFRAESFAQVGVFSSRMFGLESANFAQPWQTFVTRDVLWALAAGVIFSMPIMPQWRVHAANRLAKWSASGRTGLIVTSHTLEIVLIAGLFFLVSAWLAAGTYNPFIYFRF